MAIHREAIRIRLDKLHEMIAMLETIRARGKDTYNNDELLQAAAERALQIASQCVLDLLIITDSEVARPDIRAVQVKCLLYGFHCPMDLLVYTPEEVKACLQRGNLFIREILEEGRLLYADKSFEICRTSAENLNRFYIDEKYSPGFPIWYPIEEAKIAVDQAREILTFIRKKLTTEQPETPA